MTRVHKSAMVPYSPGEMFALVADVESYPKFLPWCTDARVVSRNGEEVIARVALARSGIRQSFTTRNRLRDSERIDMHLVHGPFKRLNGHWIFESIHPRDSEHAHGCHVALNLDFEFASKLLALTFGKVFHSISSTLIDAFCARARQLYEPRR